MGVSKQFCNEARLNRLLALPRQGQPVADGNHAQVNALIAFQMTVQLAYGNCIAFLITGVGHRAIPQHIVDQYQPPGADQTQASLIVGTILLLVGIYKA